MPWCVEGPVTTPVGLTLLPEHHRGHGALYDALDRGRVDAGRLRRTLAALPRPKAADNRLVLAVDVSNWLRPDTLTSAERLFFHTYGRGRDQHLVIPGWSYSFVAALETGRTSWCQLLDAVRLGPEDAVAEVTAVQVRRVVEDLICGGQWRTDRYGAARAMAWDRIHPRLTTRSVWIDHEDALPLIEGTLIRLQVEHTFRMAKQTLGWTRPKIRTPRRQTGGRG